MKSRLRAVPGWPFAHEPAIVHPSQPRDRRWPPAHDRPAISQSAKLPRRGWPFAHELAIVHLQPNLRTERWPPAHDLGLRRGWPPAQAESEGGSLRTRGWLFAHDARESAVSVRAPDETFRMAESMVRQRSLLPFGPRGPVGGWMDDDVASAATQLFGSGPSGLLVIDARELLTSTARVVDWKSFVMGKRVD